MCGRCQHGCSAPLHPRRARPELANTCETSGVSITSYVVRLFMIFFFASVLFCFRVFVWCLYICFDNLSVVCFFVLLFYSVTALILNIDSGAPDVVCASHVCVFFLCCCDSGNAEWTVGTRSSPATRSSDTDICESEVSYHPIPRHSHARLPAPTPVHVRNRTHISVLKLSHSAATCDGLCRWCMTWCSTSRWLIWLKFSCTLASFTLALCTLASCHLCIRQPRPA